MSIAPVKRFPASFLLCDPLIVGRQAQGLGQAEWSGGRKQGQDRQGSKTRKTRKREAGKRQELTGQTLVSMTNKTNWHRQKTQV